MSESPVWSAEESQHTLALQFQALSSRISALHELAVVLNQSLELDTIVVTLRSQLKWIFDFQYACMGLTESDGAQTLYLLYTQNSESESELNIQALLEQAAAARHCQRFDGTTVLEIFRTKQQPQRWCQGYESWLVLPLESEKQFFGTIVFAHSETEIYSQDDLRIGHLLALQLANAIRNAQRFTEMNHLYAKLKNAYRELQRSEQLRSDMTKMVIHDLRNPLNIVQISLELIQEIPKNRLVTEAYPHIIRALRANKRMHNMIRDLLDFNKLEQGELQLSLSPVSVESLLIPICDEWRTKALNESKSLYVEFAATLPTLWCDIKLMRRVIDNLLNNAFKFTDIGGTIALVVTHDAQTLHIVVRDDGIGIAPEYHQRIFDKFVQLADINAPIAYEGNGLGLAFCRLVVEAHQGTILLHSTPNQGSTFEICLPLVPPPTLK